MNKLTRILFKLQQISLIFTCLSNETQPRRNHRLSGCGSAIATRKNPGNRLHICLTNIISNADNYIINTDEFGKNTISERKFELFTSLFKVFIRLINR